MRLIVVCNDANQVVSMATVSPDGLTPLRKDLPAGHRQVEVDAPEISHDLDEAEIFSRLKHLAAASRLEPSTGTLVAR